MIQLTLEEEKKRIRDNLVNLLKNKVDFALLYGSILSDRFNAESDIDIAIFLKTYPKDIRDILDIRSSISKHFSREVDAIFLNSSDLIITMQVLANGELFITNDLKKFILYKARKISEYIDFKMSRRIIEDNLLNLLYA
jgi:predicted nucleotidyltransferase